MSEFYGSMQGFRRLFVLACVCAQTQFGSATAEHVRLLWICQNMAVNRGVEHGASIVAVRQKPQFSALEVGK